MFYQNVIGGFTAMCKEIIGEKLTGIYLHGSMAMNCFNPEKSDIDLLIVIEDDITDVQKMKFMKQVVKLNEQATAKGYVESIWFDVEGAREDIADEPMYMTLNLCRVLAFLKEDLCLSKQQGGEWGIVHISERYHPLILQALNCYKTNQIMQADLELADQFTDDMLTIIGFEKEQIE